MDEYSRDVYKLVKQFNVLARKERDRQEAINKESGTTTTRRSKKEEKEEKLEDTFPPLKVAFNVQQQIKDFKVSRVPVTISFIFE